MRKEFEFGLEIEGNQEEKVIVTGLNQNNDKDFEQTMLELENLAKACGMNPVMRVVQNMQEASPTFYFGKGKVEEIKEAAIQHEAEVVLFNDALSPIQLRNLQRELEVPILDRTALILEIFSSRARSRESKMQVEAARLHYFMPRLIGLRASLGRQGGGSGLNNKGSGEKKLELDKRRIQKRIHELEQELKEVAKERQTQRKQRAQSGIPRVSLVGYTNAGKSTLLNAMLDSFVVEEAKKEEKKVFEKDMLFATLDTTVRKITPTGRRSFLLADTVGFINKLPHDLVKAFHSTLEEVQEADLLLHVVDFSDENFKDHIRVTQETLAELGADDIPTIYVYNKADLRIDVLPMIKENQIYMSAKKKQGLDELIQLMERVLYAQYANCEFLIPYEKGALVSYFKETAVVEKLEYEEGGICLQVQCTQADADKYEEYRK